MYEGGTDPRAYFEKSTGEMVMTVGDCLTYWKEQYVDIALRPKTQALYQATVLKYLVGIPVFLCIIILAANSYAEEK